MFKSAEKASSDNDNNIRISIITKVVYFNICVRLYNINGIYCNKYLILSSYFPRFILKLLKTKKSRRIIIINYEVNVLDFFYL